MSAARNSNNSESSLDKYIIIASPNNKIDEPIKIYDKTLKNSRFIQSFQISYEFPGKY